MRVITLNTSINKGPNTRYRGVSSSKDLNEFGEGAIRDIGELFTSVSEALLLSRRLELTVGSQIESLNSLIGSLNLSAMLGQITVPVTALQSIRLTPSSLPDLLCAYAELPESFRGVTEFTITPADPTANPNTILAAIPAAIRPMLSTDTIDYSAVTYSIITDVPKILQDFASYTVSYLDDDDVTWVDLAGVGTWPAAGQYWYDTSLDRIIMDLAMVTDERQVRISSGDNTVTLSGASSPQDVAADRSKYYASLLSNTIIVNSELKFPEDYTVGAENVFIGGVELTLIPIQTTLTLDAPSKEVLIDFYAQPNVWTATSSRLAPDSINLTYRLLTESAFCHHNPVYGQITLPFSEEVDKCLLIGSDQIVMPDSLHATTRVFRIHNQVIDSDGRYYYNPYNEESQGTPYNLQAIIENSASTEITAEQIVAIFEQPDPLSAMDGDDTTPAWYLAPFQDVDDALGISGHPTTQLVVFYDIEIPQDINSNMYFNVIRIHPLPLFRMHLVDVRFSVGGGFSTTEVGNQFRMDMGPDTSVSSALTGRTYDRTMQRAILGQNPFVFYNAGMMELHVKRTEANFVRLVFACDYSRMSSLRGRPIIGATSIGIYHRSYASSGSFQIEFDADSGAVIDTLGDNASSWVNNQYALFNPLGDDQPSYAAVIPVMGSVNKLRVEFGVRTDDLTGAIRPFDNSATPSFYRIITR